MKKLFLALAILIGLNTTAQWNWVAIKGNGVLKKETREVGSFSGITSSGSWDVMIAYGNSTSIEVEGDENLLEYIETKVEGGKLQIKAKKNGNLRSKNKITIYVSMTKMTSLALSGSGDMIGKGKFNYDATTNVMVSGSGSIKVEFDRFTKVDASVSGSGNVVLKGSSQEVETRISGSGNIDCNEVVCDEAAARISGSGNIKLFANKSLDIHISGSGNVYYKGAATDIRTHKAGSGRIVKGK